jgi:transcription antitermination factor NusG
MIANYDDLEAVEEMFEKGESVKIIAGPLQNQIGELIEYKSAKKVLVKIENTGFSLLVSLPNNIIRKV